VGAHFDTSEIRHLQVDLDAAPARVRARIPAAVSKTAHDIASDAQILAPVDTGNLRGSIGTDLDDDGLGATVGPTASYGAIVEWGSAPHIIRPKNGGFLRFVIGGRVVFTRQVMHPGTAPQPYLGPAFDRNIGGFSDALADTGDDFL
jgi:hypothetical protein